MVIEMNRKWWCYGELNGALKNKFIAVGCSGKEHAGEEGEEGEERVFVEYHQNDAISVFVF
jgi:hypothetical protein